MGLASLQWPNAELHFARAGKAADIPVTLSTACTVDIEQFAAAGGDNAWYQLYPPKDEEVNDDLIKRAQDSGCKALNWRLSEPLPVCTWRQSMIS